jgi:hypothetical protein
LNARAATVGYDGDFSRRTLEELTAIVGDPATSNADLSFAAEELGAKVQQTHVLKGQGLATLLAAEARSAGIQALLALRSHASPLAREGAVLGLSRIQFREDDAREAMRKTMRRWLRREPSPGVRTTIEEALENLA